MLALPSSPLESTLMPSPALHRMTAGALALSTYLVVLLGGLTASCSSTTEGESGSGSAASGMEGAACRADGSCDEGLKCLSNLCVDPGSGADGGSSGQGQAGSGSGGDEPGAGGASSSGGGGADSGAGGAGGASGGGTDASTGGAGGDAAVVCSGAHPNVDGQRRFCDPDACYCTDPFDTCFAATVAEACCNVTPDCGGDASPGGVDCTGEHPIIGPPRTCESGFCLCSDGSTVDKCLPEAVAVACCPPDITLDCVP